jgi:hypothetical protein
MFVESEDRVQADTPIARALDPNLEPQEILAAMDGHIYIEPEADGRLSCRHPPEDIEEWVTTIPASARLRVDKGDRVEVGDQLTEGARRTRARSCASRAARPSRCTCWMRCRRYTVPRA